MDIPGGRCSSAKIRHKDMNILQEICFIFLTVGEQISEIMYDSIISLTLLTVVVVPQVAVNMQQTPNPAAQFPSTLPLLSSHSSEVMQVPNMVLSEEPVHCSCCKK